MPQGMGPSPAPPHQVQTCSFSRKYSAQARHTAAFQVFEVSVISMIYFLVVLHVIVCLFLIGVVLLQQGKSADLAGAFGGQGSQTAFGPRGAANLLTKLTAWAAILFMVISVSLTILLARSSGDKSVLTGTATHQTTPKK